MNSKYKPKYRKPLSHRKKNKGNIKAFTKTTNAIQSTSSISTNTNIHGKCNYSLTDDDISLATPLDTVGYQNSLLDMNHIQPSSSSPINKEVNMSSSLFNTVLNISPINKSETLSTKDQTQYEEYPNLCTSDSPAKNNTEEIEVCGRRIVNILNLFEEIKNIDNHEPFDCSFKNMIVIGEKRIGFKSIFTFKCSMCQIKKTVGTENNIFMPINTSAVIGVLNIGCGYSQLQEFMSAMEVPTIHITTYQAEHDRICKGYEESALETMKEAAKVEAELAIAEGEVDVDGTPLVAVVADGSWCKRSYRTMYNSPSGMVKAGKLDHRKLLQKNILRLRRGIVSAIKYRRQNKNTENDLRNDILNSIDHAFGQHDKCASYFCDKVEDVNYLEKIKSTDPNFYSNIMQPVRYLARNSRSLLQNVDSNVVESLNGIIAKLIGGKRINFAMSRSYQGRVAAATVMKNTKRPMYKLHKTLLEHSPGKKWPSSKLEIQRQRKQLRQNELRSKTYRTKLKFQCDYVDPSYGEKSQKPDMTSEQFDDEKKNIINLLKEMAANCDVIEKETVEQSASSKWLEYRRHLITASNFGRIICLRADTGCENVVKMSLVQNAVHNGGHNLLSMSLMFDLSVLATI
ncbi:hypothetical protein ACI65C_010288 [Semiaphis heraclei]